MDTTILHLSTTHFIIFSAIAGLLAVLLGLFREQIRVKPVPVSIILVAMVGTLISCGTHDQHDGHDHHAHAHEVGDLTLNHGEKWEADDHTRAVVSEMQQTVSTYEKSEGQDYQVISDSLTSQLNRLIVGCTMKGPAHDELHKWLVPLTESIKDLSGSENASSASKSVGEIAATLALFDQYFE